MITHLELKNFQCHDLLRIKLDPQVTTIVGPSDSGKSAVIRALRWLVFNRPLGDSFVQYGKKEVSVRVKVDGKWVQRMKGNGKNCYVIDGKELKSVGTDVPEEVAFLLGLSEENFQYQHDGPFWFSLSPGEAAKQLNKIVDLEMMDKVMSVLSSRVRKVRAERELAEGRVLKCEQRLKELDFVPVLKGEYENLLELSRKREECKSLLDSLVSLVRSVKECRERKEFLGGIVEDGVSLLGIGDRLVQLRDSLRRLVSLVSEAKELAVLARVEIPDVSGVEVLLERLVSVKDKLSRLVEAVGKAKDFHLKIRFCDEKIRELKEEMIKESGGVCPLCGGLLSEGLDVCGEDVNGQGFSDSVF